MIFSSHSIGSLGRMMLLATGLGVIFTSTGLALSYEPDLPAGATIVLLTGATYLLSALGAISFKGLWWKVTRGGQG